MPVRDGHAFDLKVLVSGSVGHQVRPPINMYNTIQYILELEL